MKNLIKKLINNSNQLCSTSHRGFKKQEFQKRFPDLDINSKEIRLFQNPFDCNVTEIPSRFQMEIIDLQANVQIKDKTRKETIFINI